MKNFRQISTTLTIITFFIVGVTGVLMFFGFKNKIVPIHEFIGLSMVGATILHIIANSNPFKKYFTGKKSLIIIASLIVPIIVALSLPTKAKAPYKEVYQSILSLNLNTAMDAFDTNTTNFQNYLDQHNIKIENKSIKDFGLEHNIDQVTLVNLILNKI